MAPRPWCSIEHLVTVGKSRLSLGYFAPTRASRVVPCSQGYSGHVIPSSEDEVGDARSFQTLFQSGLILNLVLAQDGGFVSHRLASRA